MWQGWWFISFHCHAACVCVWVGERRHRESMNVLYSVSESIHADTGVLLSCMVVGMPEGEALCGSDYWIVCVEHVQHADRPKDIWIAGESTTVA